MAMKKAGAMLPPAPQAGATAKQIEANTRQVRKAIAKKNKELSELQKRKVALAKNKEARKEFARTKTKTTTRKKGRK